jgi:hypothetical protein
MQGISPISGSPERIRPEIPKRFRSRSVKIPVSRNRELVSTSREILSGDTGLRAAVAEPIHPPPISGQC